MWPYSWGWHARTPMRVFEGPPPRASTTCRSRRDRPLGFRRGAPCGDGGPPDRDRARATGRTWRGRRSARCAIRSTSEPSRGRRRSRQSASKRLDGCRIPRHWAPSPVRRRTAARRARDGAHPGSRGAPEHRGKDGSQRGGRERARARHGHVDRSPGARGPGHTRKKQVGEQAGTNHVAGNR